MKVTVIKGPHFEDRKSQAQEVLYRHLQKEVSKQVSKNERKGA